MALDPAVEAAAIAIACCDLGGTAEDWRHIEPRFKADYRKQAKAALAAADSVRAAALRAGPADDALQDDVWDWLAYWEEKMPPVAGAELRAVSGAARTPASPPEPEA